MTTAPMNPLAGPAGPGKYSTRTDRLKMGSIAYGEGVETAAIQSGAPLAKSPGSMPASEVMPKLSPLTSLYASLARQYCPSTWNATHEAEIEFGF